MESVVHDLHHVIRLHLRPPNEGNIQAHYPKATREETRHRTACACDIPESH